MPAGPARDPYPFYDWVRENGPIWYYPIWDVWLVTGYDEALAIYHDQDSWSNCNTVSGPFFQMSAPLEGDDITEIIEAHRDELRLMTHANAAALFRHLLPEVTRP